jgi:hypothetical protein
MPPFRHQCRAEGDAMACAARLNRKDRALRGFEDAEIVLDKDWWDSVSDEEEQRALLRARTTCTFAVLTNQRAHRKRMTLADR